MYFCANYFSTFCRFLSNKQKSNNMYNWCSTSEYIVLYNLFRQIWLGSQKLPLSGILLISYKCWTNQIAWKSIIRQTEIPLSFIKQNKYWLNTTLKTNRLKPFHYSIRFLYPLETSERLSFSDVFRGIERDQWNEPS